VATGPAYSIAENDTGLKAGARKILGKSSVLLAQPRRTVRTTEERSHASLPGTVVPEATFPGSGNERPLGEIAADVVMARE
ncbi:hypothetical protein ACIRD9_42235, partial [Streptomyces violaceus]|uniref:hypothetical protein n=1 Tax=Streptomyces violaceus TaxID=1936 RepID=UPI00382DD010